LAQLIADQTELAKLMALNDPTIDLEGLNAAANELSDALKSLLKSTGSKSQDEINKAIERTRKANFDLIDKIFQGDVENFATEIKHNLITSLHELKKADMQGTDSEYKEAKEKFQNELEQFRYFWSKFDDLETKKTS